MRECDIHCRISPWRRTILQATTQFDLQFSPFLKWITIICVFIRDSDIHIESIPLGNLWDNVVTNNTNKMRLVFVYVFVCNVIEREWFRWIKKCQCTIQTISLFKQCVRMWCSLGFDITRLQHAFTKKKKYHSLTFCASFISCVISFWSLPAITLAVSINFDVSRLSNVSA